MTLALCTVLHAFVHMYTSMLVPLYLMMVADLHLPGARRASLLVTIYILVYCLSSYTAGVFTDRFNRKVLLGIGLLGNAAAITLIGLTRRYELLVAWSILGGMCGSLFHPAAGALAPAHYPKNPGMAIGLMGIGAGLGFFVGPRYAGWRAQTAAWQWGAIGQWQKPCIELGVVGLIVGVVFLLVAKETRTHGDTAANNGQPPAQPMGRSLSIRVAVLSLALGCRDFAAMAGLSLASLYLQRAHNFDAQRTGAVLGTMMLLSIVVNPLLVWLTPAGRRLPSLAGILVLGGAIAALVPLFPSNLAGTALCAFQTCQLGSYAISDAAMLERIPNALRGRVYGLFLTVAGTMSATGPWAMGQWTDALGPQASVPHAYFPLFGAIGVLMVLAVFSKPCLARLGPVANVVEPIEEIMPRTAEPVG
jgi:MFS family permease